MGKPTGKRETRTIVVGPDGKRFAFPASMPREEMRDRMRAAYAEETRIAQEKVKRAEIDREATAAGRAEGERAASRMGVDTPFEMAMAAPAIGMAQQSGGRRVYNREGIVLPDEAAGLSALNSAGFFIPGMVNQRFGERLEEGRRQEPGFALAGDVAGGMIPGELIGQGIAQVGKMIAPQFARLGSMLKGKPEDAPLVLGPESRIRPIDRPDAFPGDDVLTARALDQWTPPPEQQVRPMGFFGGKKPPAERTQDTIGREIKDVEKKLRRKDYTLNEAETLAEEGNLPPELRGLMIQHGDLVRESGRMQGAARTAKGGVETDSEYLRAESEMNKAADDVANAEYEIARELRDRGLNWEGDDAEFMGVVDQLRREGKLTNYLASRVEDLRAASTRMFNAEAKMKSRVKSFGLLTERGRDAVEQTFGAAYMSGTGSVAGGQYDLNGDGEIDNADLAIGSGIGLAAFASPLALRKVAELGGRLKGTRPQGFAASAGSGKRAAGYNNDLIEGSATFSDPRLNDKQNKILELYYNGASNEVIADEMDLSSYNAAAVTISKILKDFPDLPRNPAKKGKPPTARGELRRLFDTGLSDGQIATRTGKSIANIRTQRMVYNKERTQQGLPKIGSRKSKEPQPKD